MTVKTPFSILTALFVATLCRGEDAAALYKAKCASCHGAAGAGRSAMKGSDLLTPEVKQRSDEQLANAIAKGSPKSKNSHAYETKGVTRDQVSLLVQHVRELQRKAK